MSGPKLININIDPNDVIHETDWQRDNNTLRESNYNRGLPEPPKLPFGPYTGKLMPKEAMPIWSYFAELLQRAAKTPLEKAILSNWIDGQKGMKTDTEPLPEALTNRLKMTEGIR